MRLVPLTIILFVLSRTACARPIEVEVGFGRNANVVKLVDQAQDQMLRGDFANARQNVDEAIKADPNYWPALFIRAEVLMNQNRYEAALQDCERILKQDSTVVEAALLRAEANFALGRYAVSLKEVQHCISIQPRRDALARAYNTRALLRLYCPDPAIRNPQKAVVDATIACKLMDWSDGELLDMLAKSEAATGDFDSAIHCEQEAMKSAKVRDDEKREYQKHLTLFQQHKAVSGTAH